MTDSDAPDQQPLFPPPWPTAPGAAQPTPPSALPPAPPAPTTRSHRFPAVLALVGVVALVAGAAGAALGITVSNNGSNAPDTSSFVAPRAPGSQGPGSLSDRFGNPSGSGSSTPGTNIDIDGIAAAVSPAIVNIATTLSDGGQAAGSGMVLTSSGEVLTNNHVISGATKIQVEVGVTGKTYSAKVLGYDVNDDVALIKLNGASGMKTIRTASAASVSRNDSVVAIGNALGRFGDPTVVSGTVSALHQQVTAGDGLDEETLSDMIRIAAAIQPGDSGGALLNDQGRVIGMNTAADAGSGQYGYRSGTTGFAIPIHNAISIVDEIKNGDTSNGAHIGDRALLGIVLEASSAQSPFGSDGGGSSANGAGVADVSSDSPAADVGLEPGSTITALGSQAISSVDDLRAALDRFHPGDTVKLTWTDASGDRHRESVTLAKGPPA
jgi:S1-C subfamily serine protease